MICMLINTRIAYHLLCFIIFIFLRDLSWVWPPMNPKVILVLLLEFLTTSMFSLSLILRALFISFMHSSTSWLTSKHFIFLIDLMLLRLTLLDCSVGRSLMDLSLSAFYLLSEISNFFFLEVLGRSESMFVIYLRLISFLRQMFLLIRSDILTILLLYAVFCFCNYSRGEQALVFIVFMLLSCLWSATNLCKGLFDIYGLRCIQLFTI